MSETQRYKLEVKDSDAELVPCDFGSYVEYREHVKRIKQLEQELEEAKKDQARYYWVQDWLESRVVATTAFCSAVSRSEYDQSIDAAIKESSK